MNRSNSPALPFLQGPALKDFLNLAHPSELDDLFEKSLTDPIYNFLQRPSKNIRNQIVQLGFSLAIKDRASIAMADLDVICNSCCAILEIFHAGSLVVDDIQDDSEYRRGQKTLHQLYGMPLALNAGNWLYFLPFKHIEEMPLSQDRRSALIQACNETLLRAHYGQALDLGVPVDSIEQDRVPAVSLAAMELKSGVLTGLALKIGAIALGSDDTVVKALDSFGRKLGIALQMMDDLGSLTSKNNPAKKCEDLKLKRLGFVFSVAAELLPNAEYKKLQAIIEDSDDCFDEALQLLTFHKVPEKAKRQAHAYLDSTIAALCSTFPINSDEEQFLQSIQTHLVKSYE